MTDQCARFMISGHVQGVFFRASTREQALRLGITGRATNLPDGRVEVIACGAPDALDDLHRWLHEGPPRARVDNVTRDNIEPRPMRGFQDH